MLPLHTDKPLYKILKKEEGIPYGTIEDQAEKKPNIPDIAEYIGDVRAFEFHVKQVEEDLRSAKEDDSLQELHKAELEEERLLDDMVGAAEAVASLKELMEEAKRNLNGKTGKDYQETLDRTLFLRTSYLVILNRFEKYREELNKLVGLSFMMSNSTADKEAIGEAEEIKEKLENCPEIVSKISALAQDKNFPQSNPASGMKDVYRKMQQQLS